MLLPTITGADMGMRGYENWLYKDISWMTQENIDKFTKIIGSSNLCWLSIAARNADDGTIRVRGSALVSPEGIENARKYLQK